MATGVPWVRGSQVYGILTFVVSSFGQDSFVLTEGSILRDLEVTSLIIMARSLD
jgi:hypothetical protein